MTDFRDTIEQIDGVRESAADPRAAYLIRSRLRRALLSCARTAAEAQDLEKPRLPGQWAIAEGADARLVEVVKLCRRIYQYSESLCQPSESFDVRWEDGWKQLSLDLDRLRAELTWLGTPDNGPRALTAAQ